MKNIVLSILTILITFSSFFFVKVIHAQTLSLATSPQLKTIDPNFLQEGNKHTHNQAVCSKTKDPAIARCFARVVVEDNTVTPFTTTKPAGLGPAELRKAYNITGKGTGTPVIALVDAYNQSNMLADLNTYSSTFNLPQMANCSSTIASATKPCFKKVDQKGGSTYPKTDGGWALETSLDVETVHSMCDNCSILLVEANSASMSDLLKAVDSAVKLGATVVSNSYGSSEAANETTYDSHFNNPGIAMMVSSGDSGYGVNYPAASRYVVAVGGTKLNLTSSGAYSSESAWSDGGSGCSSYESKPTWQKDAGCSKRTVADIAADADPTSGAAVYDSVIYEGKTGWYKVGGTSLASPLAAGIFAIGTKLSSKTQAGSFLYGLSANHLHDIAKGSNGSCSPAYLCKAGKGYDAPTGLGSPLGAF